LQKECQETKHEKNIDLGRVKYRKVVTDSTNGAKSISMLEIASTQGVNTTVAAKGPTATASNDDSVMKPQILDASLSFCRAK
jgi:hypothetical protein